MSLLYSVLEMISVHVAGIIFLLFSQTFMSKELQHQFVSYSSSAKNLTTESSGKYTVKCINQSTENCYFYLFQRTKNQNSVIASLVWFASPYKVPTNGGSITFDWQKTYTYVWQGYGSVQPTVVFEAQGLKAGAPETQVTFLIEDSTPVFGDVLQYNTPGMMVTSKMTIPDNTFGVGIGMSGQATLLVQSIPNKTQEFEVEPIYWIAVSKDIEVGEVLSESSNDPRAQFVFPANTYNLTITYTDGKFYNNGNPL